MTLADMTYKEVQEYLSDKQDLIIPLGTTEQHGAHLPLNNDVLVAEYLSGELSKRTGIMIAPTISYGVNLPLDSMMYGTAGVSEALLSDMIKEIVSCWKRQGFTRFFVVNYHGDPFHVRAVQNAGENIFLLEPYDIEYDTILEKQTTIRHACEAETSVALYLYLNKVKMDKVEENDIKWPEFKPYLFHEKTLPPEGYVGCLGAPSSATREKGEYIVNSMIAEMMAQFDKANS